MYTSRKCPACGMDRFPDEKVVKEKKQHYVVYECRCCHHKDIERIVKTTIKLWDPKWGKFEDANDDAFLEEGPDA